MAILNPRAEVGRLADGLQALVRLLGQRPCRAGGTGRRRPASPTAADAAAQLVHLAEAEQVGALDHERVHRRHVDAATR